MLISGTLPGVIGGSVVRVELLPGPHVFDAVAGAVLAPLGLWLALTRPARRVSRLRRGGKRRRFVPPARRVGVDHDKDGIGHTGGARRPWIPAINALVRSIAPGTLVMHAGGVATVQEAGDVIHAGAAGTGATSAIIKASDRGAAIEGFLRAVRNTWDADHPGPLRAR